MKDELLLSDEQFILAETASVEPYLFTTIKGRAEFVIIQEEMEELNDYCVISGNAVKAILKRKQKAYQKYLSGHERAIHPDFGELTDEVISGLEEIVIPKWETIYSFMHQTTSLLLLHTFTERALKGLCDSLAPDGAPTVKQQKGKSKIDSFLYYLSEVCNLQFIEPKGTRSIRDQVRHVRNCFAHGDWDDLERTAQKINLRRAFLLTSALFREIELAVERARS